MDISIFALEKLIKQNEELINNSKKQLRDIEAGVTKVSSMKLASVEKTLEEATKNYEEYKKMYDSIPSDVKKQYEEQQRVQEALAKQTYYKLQKIRMKKNKNLTRVQKLEAMMVLDELPDDVNFDDNQLVEISYTIIKNNIREAVELEDELIKIKEEFITKVRSIEDGTDQKYFTLIDTYIPIIILHFSALFKDVEEKIAQYNEENPQDKKFFKGFPKYEDWWFEELWKNHQAYFALYKWSKIIENQCITKQQKIIWNKIFPNWISIKKMLNNKEENTYHYNLCFDEMLMK